MKRIDFYDKKARQILESIDVPEPKFLIYIAAELLRLAFVQNLKLGQNMKTPEESIDLTLEDIKKLSLRDYKKYLKSKKEGTKN